MIIKGEIQRVDKRTFNGKDGKPVEMFTVLVGDKSKVFRCTTPLQINLSGDNFRKKFDNRKLHLWVDEPVTLAITEMSAKNAFVSLRGEIVQGHHAAEVLYDMLEDSIPGIGAEASAEKPPALGQPSKPAKAA